MVSLGVLYANGQGVAQDFINARELYEKAADKGSADAMYNLGNLCNSRQFMRGFFYQSMCEFSLQHLSVLRPACPAGFILQNRVCKAIGW